MLGLVQTEQQNAQVCSSVHVLALTNSDPPSFSKNFKLLVSVVLFRFMSVVTGSPVSKSLFINFLKSYRVTQPRKMMLMRQMMLMMLLGHVRLYRV